MLCKETNFFSCSRKRQKKFTPPCFVGLDLKYLESSYKKVTFCSCASGSAAALNNVASTKSSFEPKILHQAISTAAPYYYGNGISFRKSSEEPSISLAPARYITHLLLFRHMREEMCAWFSGLDQWGEIKDLISQRKVGGLCSESSKLTITENCSSQ